MQEVGGSIPPGSTIQTVDFIHSPFAGRIRKDAKIKRDDRLFSSPPKFHDFATNSIKPALSPRTFGFSMLNQNPRTDNRAMNGCPGSSPIGQNA
jgi:hypothetical protein